MKHYPIHCCDLNSTPKVELNKPIESLILLLGFVLVFASCKEDNTLQPRVSKLNRPPFSIVSVNPPVGYSGTLITVVLRKERDSVYLWDQYELNGYREYAYPSQGDTLKIRFPLLQTFTGLYALAFDLRIDSMYRIKIDFTPYPETCAQPICVKWFYEDTVSHLLFQNYYIHGAWSGRISQDTVYLQYLLEFPDAVSRGSAVFLNHGVHQLPSFLSYTLSYSPGGFRDTLRRGLVKIDKWDPQGIVSGAIFSSDTVDPYLRFFQTYFYVRLQ